MPTATTVPVKMAQRRDTAANWTSVNPTLLAGEIGIESDTGKWKVGNGSSAWSSLSYIAAFSLTGLPVSVAQGGTGQTTYTNGQLLIGNTTGNTLTKATLTAGTGISITNGTGSITITSTGLQTTGGTLTGDLLMDNQSDVRFGEATANGSNWVALQGPANIASNVTWTLPAADGTVGQVLKTDGSGALGWVTAATGDVVLASSNAFTGANTFTNSTGQIFRQASTQDGVLLRGRAGGTSSYTAEIVPNTLTASRTITLPDATGTVALLGTAQTFTAVQTLTDPAIIGTILEDVYTISDGAAFEVDPGNGSVQLITLGASRTPKATNFAAGEAVTLMVDDGSAYSITWTDSTWGTGGVTWTGGTAPTLATSGYTVIQLWKVGTKVYGANVGSVA